MIPRPSLFSLVLATALLQSAWASASAFGGCYDTSSLDLESNGNITTTAECSVSPQSTSVPLHCPINRDQADGSGTLR